MSGPRHENAMRRPAETTTQTNAAQLARLLGLLGAALGTGNHRVMAETRRAIADMVADLRRRGDGEGAQIVGTMVYHVEKVLADVKIASMPPQGRAH